MVTKFPIPDVGHRHVMMCKAVGSLVGRSYSDDLITGVMMDWWEAFYAQGRARTDRERMAQELLACLRATRANANFQRAHGESYHEAACAAIPLTDKQRGMLRASIGMLAPTASPQPISPDVNEAGLADSEIPPEEHTSEGLSTTDCKGVTRK